MKCHVNENCIGCGLCVGICPSVFHMTDEGMAEAIETQVPDGDISDANSAKEGCPVSAIETFDESSM